MVLLALTGCKATDPPIQPPPLREEYTLPPDDDVRFSAPPVFPKEARNNNRPGKLPDTPGAMPPTFGGANRMSGPGMAGGY
jgi:hypothetical protein